MANDKKAKEKKKKDRDKKRLIHNYRLNDKSLILNDSMIGKIKFYLLPT